MSRMRVLVLGRQGAGKGTQCVRLARRLGVPHISTGDVLRAAVRAGSELGRQATSFMEAGQLVPDELILGVVADRLQEPDAREGFVLDGFPRNLAQGQALVSMLGDDAIDAAVDIDVPNDVVIRRIASRRVCGDCASISVAPDPAVPAMACACGGRAVQRTDDTEFAVSRRLAIYEEQTRPLVHWLSSLDLLVTVDGTGSPDQVETRIVDALRLAVAPAAEASGELVS